MYTPELPAFASVSEAMDTALAALSYLAAADPATLPAETQAECLRGLERTDAISTAVRAWFLSAFTAGQGYAEDADYSPRAWLMHKSGITRGAAASHTAWARRAGTHPRVVAALVTEDLSESYARAICRWTDKLPEKFREESDELLLAAAAAGLDLRDLAALGPAPAGRQLDVAGGVDRAGPRGLGRPPRRGIRDRKRRRRVAGRRRRRRDRV